MLAKPALPVQEELQITFTKTLQLQGIFCLIIFFCVHFESYFNRQKKFCHSTIPTYVALYPSEPIVHSFANLIYIECPLFIIKNDITLDC